ncbi:DNA (cytosine-5-)-methyltransferase [Salmonella enterica subsp. enterica serovar Edinburgh]|nr:DNA (cytosine-5-)-methyltransferase [Salmonella enterica subsp. enterica serovar Edinburgh]EBH8946426.1 DNA (cytosine-5-)-methyltransferase [Salmonella enterica subsp. enterica serovar 6,7:b:-]EJA5741190.1 DNA (cytosine-5-)-methyltransferase [Salmonella enterica]EJA5755255.1 DNA (cytosine-5-)-methyltransferase [Salmonella enterica]EJX4155962.1 DNA (cytosine-5-)-methyltransferase [Salmonella enterica]
MKEFFSESDVADILSVSKRNVSSWAKSGKLVPQLDPETHTHPYTKSQLADYDEFSAMFTSKWDKELAIKPKRKYTLIELFAGAGGLALGLEKAGFSSLLLNEKDKHACNTLRKNRPEWNVVEDDIANLDFTEYSGQVDLLTGGFPCQPFSHAGKKLGFEDIRGTLVFEMIRAMKEIKPKVFLAENVSGLKTNDDGKTLENIKNIVQESGYTIIEEDIYKAIFYKVPQKRERLIIIAIRNDLVGKLFYKKPSPYHSIMSLRDAFKKGDLYDTDVPDSEGQSYPKRKGEIIANVPEGGYWRDLPIELQKEYMGSSFYSGGGKTGMARRLAWDQPSLTLTCSPAQKQTERCHPSENRPLTTREYARIQTFPDDWIFCGPKSEIYKQIGNAVPVNMASCIGRAIVKMLNSL